jgi:hypothetical protein
MEKRTYRAVQASDLPNVQSGKLKAFWTTPNSTIYRPAKLVSVKYRQHKDNTAWLYEGDGTDIICNSDLIVVDVTPAKRYAVWNHKGQKFCSVDAFMSRTDAEIWRDNYYDSKVHRDFYVVEWEIKEDK